MRCLVAVMASIAAACGAGHPEIAAVTAFPTPAELEAIAAPAVAARAALPVSASEELTIEDAPELGGGGAAIDGDPVADALAGEASSVQPTAGMRCAAGALARFYLRENARPADPVLEFLLGRCGVSAVDVEMAVHVEVGTDDPDPTPVYARLAESLRPLLSRGAIRHLTEVGSARAVGEGATAFVALAAPRRVALSATRLEDGRFLISGRVLSERMRAVEAWVGQGDYAVERCAPQAGVELPDLRFTCEMNSHDATARVDLIGTPRQRLLERRLASLLLHRDDDASRAHRPPPELPATATTADDPTAGFAAALDAARDEAGRDPVAFAPGESARHAALLTKLVASRAAREAPTAETVALGLLAGWRLEASIVRAELYVVEGAARDPAALLRAHLTRPFARRVLLSPHADHVAIAARETARGLAASITLYRDFDDDELAEVRRRWTEHLQAERARANVAPLVVLGDVADLQQEADRVTEGGVHPREALDDAMARLRGRLGRTVRCFSADAHDPRSVELPVEFLDSGELSAVVGVAWLRPAGAAWTQWVLYLCVFPE